MNGSGGRCQSGLLTLKRVGVPVDMLGNLKCVLIPIYMSETRSAVFGSHFVFLARWFALLLLIRLLSNSGSLSALEV